MNQQYISALEVVKTEFVYNPSNEQIAIRYTLEDGSIALVPLKEYPFVTATTLHFS